MARESERSDEPAVWKPREERRQWPWILLVIVVIGVVVNVLLTI
ncbi:hypothetical protein [Streptoalloteichus hindustanus]|uniref:Uncharacterized protein n=1 Tax=Streptoalloteichus hindustanus TaxID=2017 RepID=A0A1M5EXG0_STRHI|nr:hypothetical protein [Streptoalloteichus hindustanus]SHF83915.1 hypothetical protein SAMN05444320_105182 [Streptoalloteichus hindustanus]